ncbi:hypothetical protein COCNU_15G006380 [Cocos nucifera]|uniref:Uncharacterized protein n=1 Tax=Cocos nucifera TaxID=13894 RepID=A0A8K0IXH6_COCNU|nr:hypothetical protein COCNU_15G006380 [Cocos nucifera]
MSWSSGGGNPSRRCLHPSRISSAKPTKPQVASFGKAQAAPVEPKCRALQFLQRLEKPSDDFVAAMEEVVQQLQDAYQNHVEEWRRDGDILGARD